MQRIQKEKLAYFYLSKAIELNKECDLSYSLRALIKAEINTEIQYDASKAVSLNPNARNYFILAKVMDYLNSNDFDDIGFFSHESSTDYLNKAIRLRPDFSCAYYERAFHYHFIGDGINDFLRCIETDPKHKPYYPLSMVLIAMNENKKALNFSLNGVTIRGDNIHFHNLFACANNIIGNYEEVLNQYKKINDILLKNGESKLNSKRFLNDFINLKFFYAFKFYSNMEFNKAKKLFVESIEEWQNTGVGSPHDIDKEGPYRKYLISHLKSNNSKISINENNPIFLKFEGLIKSYNEKFPNHSIMSKSELNINNLMIYRTTSKIGFGKYEYEKISEIIEKDPNYIMCTKR
jgi:tetratricopeptide (TPR) repeat protein